MNRSTKRTRTVNDLLNQSPMPTIDKAIASIRVREHANSSMLGQRPYATHVDGFGWIIDSVSEAHAQFHDVPNNYPVTVLPERYFDWCKYAPLEF